MDLVIIGSGFRVAFFECADLFPDDLVIGGAE